MAQRETPAEPHGLTDDEVTELVIRYIRQRPGDIQVSANPWVQFASMLGYQVHTDQFRQFQSLNRDLDERAGEMAHFLSLQGILMPKAGAGGGTYRVTKYGQQLLEQETAVLTDPSGYIALVQSIPGVDGLTIEYLAEAVEGHRRFLDRSAAVMLGAAAENMLVALGEGLRAACKKLNVQVRRNLTTWRVALLRSAIVETVKDQTFIQALNSSLVASSPLSEDDKKLLRELESTVAILAQFYADTRNQAGHPKPVRPERAVLLAYLKAFPEYARRVGAVLEILSKV